jgi:hypothetical protein
MYAQGAGLGASKGREVGKYTEGYSGYVDVVKDAVSAMIERATSRDQDQEYSLSPHVYAGSPTLRNLIFTYLLYLPFVSRQRKRNYRPL